MCETPFNYDEYLMEHNIWNYSVTTKVELKKLLVRI